MGKSVTDAMLDYGAPQNAFDLPDGRRAFQWVYNTTYVTPTTTTTNANVVGGGYNMAWVNSNTTIAGGQPLTARCVYTLIGTWDAGQQTYIITEYRKPSFMCE